MASVESLVRRLVSRQDIGGLDIKMRVRSSLDMHDTTDLRVILVTPKPYIMLTTSRQPWVEKGATVEEIHDKKEE